MPTQEVVVAFKPNETLVQQFMPVFTPNLALQRYQVVKDLIDEILKPGHDFGVIPGTGDKATLLKPGAEKLCTFFGMVPRYSYENVIEDWGTDSSEPLFSYRVKSQLWRGDYMAGEGIGYASSRESKHRYRWVDEDAAKRMGLKLETLAKRDGRKKMFEFDFAIDKAETTGPYGKPAEHWSSFQAAINSGTARRVNKKSSKGKELSGWELDIGQIQYRIPNPDIADVINTVLKMALKRALVAAVIITVNVSDRFTQDVEDFIDVDYEDASRAAPPSVPGQRYSPAQQEVLDRKLTETATVVGPEPEKPWSTWGQMLTKFTELNQLAYTNGFGSVYETTLREHGVTDPSKFSDPRTALACYRAIEANLAAAEQRLVDTQQEVSA